MELRIDPEFRDKIPPLTQEEYEQLEANIIEDGEIYEPIAVWNGTIIDGHNRWKIYLAHPELPEPKIREMDFPDKYAAFDWMYKKQLGRRNLTDEQKTYMIGKMYEARKLTSAFHGNQYAPSGEYQSGNHHNKGKTGEVIAKELGIGYGTVVRAKDFAEGLDAIREESPEAADKILQGNSGASKSAVQQYPKMEPDERKEFVAAIEAGEKPKRKSTNPDGYNSESRKLNAEIRAIADDMYNPDTTPEYTLIDLIDEIRADGEMYIKQLERTLAIRKDLYAGDEAAQNEVDEVITSVLVENINKLMEGIINA